MGGYRILIFQPWFRESHYKKVVSYYDGVGLITCQGPDNWYLDGKPIELNRFVVTSSSYQHYEVALSYMREAMPLFSRFYDSQPFLDLDLHLLSIQVVKLTHFLKSSNVRWIQFGYYSNHHISSRVLEVAALLANCKLLFEFAVPGTPYVVPFFQDSLELTSKRPLPYKFNQNSKAKLTTTWKFNSISQEQSQRIHRNFYSALFAAITVTIKVRFKTMLRSLSRRHPIKHNPTNINQRHYTLKRLAEIMFEQKKALRLFQEFCLVDSEIVLKTMNSIDQDKTKHLVIFANYQPEATTFPDGGEFTNYLQLVLKIRALGFSGRIFFREHPATFVYAIGDRFFPTGIARTTSLYRELRLLDVFFLSPDQIPKLGANSIVLTLTGSIAVERALEGLSTLTSGFPWYRGMPGAIDFVEYLSGSSCQEYQSLPSRILGEDAQLFLDNLLDGRCFRDPSLIPHSSESENERLELLDLFDSLYW